MASALNSLEAVRSKLDEVKRFLSVSLSIANAHTVEFYTRNVWDQFMAVPPADVLSAITSDSVHKGAPEDYLSGRDEMKTTFGFCDDSKRLVDVAELLEAAKAHSLPGLGLCLSRNELLLSLRDLDQGSPQEEGSAMEPEEFMTSKKSHEVQAMSEVVARLAQRCRVTQVVDVGSGKGYLCSFLSLRYGLRVFGVDSSLTNTHGAQERNRKLKKYSRAYQKHTAKGRPPRAAPPAGVEDITASQSDGGGGVDKHAEDEEHRDAECDETELQPDTVTPRAEEEEVTSPPPLAATPTVADPPDAEAGDPFAGALSVDAVEPASPPRVPPGQLSAEERERRRRENLERKAQSGADSSDSGLYSPFTSYVTAETELREIIAELEEAVMVGLHTCGDLAPSMLRMFVAKRELVCVCSVGCCYHLLSEEYDPSRQEGPSSVCGFPMSRYLRDQSWFCGRNARMSACLALERVAVGQGIQMESLFYRAVLHVILRDHYGAFKSEKRVGNIYSKASSFVDYVQRALRRLELDEGKLSSSVIQDYHDVYRPRMCEMQAFNMLKVTLAPCIEGLLLLDRLCYLKEQEDVSFSALVQLFDPVQSPRCYGVVGVKTPGTAGETPGTAGENTPGTAGEKTPGTAGETPGTAGETPGTAGETPGTAGEKTPGTAGERTPGTAGERTPGTAGERTPGTAGETPGTAGEKTPGTAGEKTPGTAGETPGTAGETPGTAGETPGTAGETPGTAGETPGTAGEKTPGTAGETPGTAGETPGTAGEKTPGTAGETPGTAGETETPGTAGVNTPGTAGETPGTAGVTPGTAGLNTPGRAGAVDTPTS